MANILVSGYTGFVGSFLVSLFSSAHTVYGIGRKVRPDATIPNIKYSDLDSFSEAIDIIIHCAGLAHDASKGAAQKVYEEANIETTKKLVHWANSNDVRQFIYLSTIKIFGNQNNLNNQSVPQPDGIYGKTKLSAEVELNTNLDAKTNTIILRPCMIYGPGNKGNLPKLMHFLKKGFPYPFYKLDHKRSMLAIENLGAVINRLIDKPIKKAAYLIADDAGLSTSEIIDLTENVWGTKFRKFGLPEFIFRIVKNQRSVEKMTSGLKVSNAALLTALGWDKMPYSSSEKLSQTMKAWK